MNPERTGANGGHPEHLNVGPEVLLLAAGAALIGAACARKEKHTKTFIGGLALLAWGSFTMVRKGKKKEQIPAVHLMNEEQKLSYWKQKFGNKTDNQ